MTASKRIILNAIIILASIATASAVIAAKGGNGRGTPGSEPPPECSTDEAFPAMILKTKSTRKTPGVEYLAGADACRLEALPQGGSMHISDSGTGIIVWSEDSDGDLQYIVKARTFETQQDGTFVLDPAFQILPLQDETPENGQEDYYFGLDVWGNQDHSLLYLSAVRTTAPNTSSETKASIIYTLNTSNGISVDHREILHVSRDVANPENETWVCPENLTHPEFVATCYSPDWWMWNASGTRLYAYGQYGPGVGTWQAAFRINVLDHYDPADATPEWSVSAPELVLAGVRDYYDSDGQTNLYGEPGLRAPRPGADRWALPLNESGIATEHAIVGFLDRTGNNTVGNSILINIDKCIGEYIDLGYTTGMVEGPIDLWRTNCAEEGAFFRDHVRGFSAWQSSDAILSTVSVSRKQENLYRYYVHGPLTGITELLRENIESVNSGL